MQQHGKQSLIRQLMGLGRKTTETVCIDSGEIGDGELKDREISASVQPTGIEIKETSYTRQLDCGHMKEASSVAVTCDMCGRRACAECYSICSICHRVLCRYCYKDYDNGQGEEAYCTSCYMDVRTKETAINASRAVLSFFVKK